MSSRDGLISCSKKQESTKQRNKCYDFFVRSENAKAVSEGNWMDVGVIEDL